VYEEEEETVYFSLWMRCDLDRVRIVHYIFMGKQETLPIHME